MKSRVAASILHASCPSASGYPGKLGKASEIQPDVRGNTEQLTSGIRFYVQKH